MYRDSEQRMEEIEREVELAVDSARADGVEAPLSFVDASWSSRFGARGGGLLPGRLAAIKLADAVAIELRGGQ